MNFNLETAVGTLRDFFTPNYKMFCIVGDCIFLKKGSFV